jgi:hypothetical protein
LPFKCNLQRYTAVAAAAAAAAAGAAGPRRAPPVAQENISHGQHPGGAVYTLACSCRIACKRLVSSTLGT